MKISQHSPVLACTAALLLIAPEIAANEANPDSVSVVDAINCKLDASVYNRFAMSLDGEKGMASKLGWKKRESTNPFMVEYELPTPIKVADSYSTHVVVISPTGIAAILDLADPNVIASKEGIKNAVNAAALTEKEDGLRKFMGERVLVDKLDPPKDGKFGEHVIIARSVSNVSTHPGKTLYGCSYRMQILDEDGRPL